MTLNEKIYALRTMQNLSQGDLADLLDVSRQSVSKWETGTSVPDLDKLIKMSDIFHVTLDELVLDRSPSGTVTDTDFPVGDSDASNHPEDRQTSSSVAPSRAADFTPKKLIGISLCWMAFIILLLGLITDSASLMLFSLPFILCSVICLACKRHAGLWCMWALFLSTDILLRLSTSISWHYLFVMLLSGGVLNLATIFSALLFLAAAALVIITALRLYRKEMHPKRYTPALLLGGWVILLLCAPLPILLHRQSPNVFSLFYLGGVFVYEAEIIVSALLLTLTFRYLHNRKKAFQ